MYIKHNHDASCISKLLFGFLLLRSAAAMAAETAETHGGAAEDYTVKSSSGAGTSRLV